MFGTTKSWTQSGKTLNILGGGMEHTSCVDSLVCNGRRKRFLSFMPFRHSICKNFW